MLWGVSCVPGGSWAAGAVLSVRLLALACGERLLVAAVWGAWTGFPGLRAPRFFWCACPLRAGVFLWRAVGLLFSWVGGAWRGCSFPVFVRASA